MYEFNENHMPGTFWYHPHLHGSSALQVGQGAAGMLIVDHPADYDIPDVIKDMPEHQMVFQHMSLDILRESSSISDDEVTNWVDHNFNMTNTTTDLTNFMLVNMQFLPEVTMEVDKWYRWRMALSSVRESICESTSNMKVFYFKSTKRAPMLTQYGFCTNLTSSNTAFFSQSGACEFQLLAKDGIYLTDAPRTVPAIILSPGNKADVAVRCSKIGQEYMNATDLAFDPKFGGFNPETQFAQDSPPKYQDVYTSVGNFHDPELQPIVMVIDVVSAPGTKEPDGDLEPFTVPTPCYLVDLRELNETEIEIGHFINEYWCKNPGQGNAVALPPDGTYWPSRTTPDDTCGVFGPYGVGGGLTPTMENLIPFSNSSVYINDFEVGSIQEIGEWISIISDMLHPLCSSPPC